MLALLPFTGSRKGQWGCHEVLWLGVVMNLTASPPRGVVSVRQHREFPLGVFFALHVRAEHSRDSGYKKI